MGKKLSLYMALALAVISLPAQAGYRDVVIADWPLSFWEFEDADSCDGCPCADTMCDYYPICSPGVYRGPGIELVPGPWGQAAELHGSGEFIQIYDNGRLESSPSCSLELLMKCSPTAEETYGRLISHANGGNSNYWIGITTAGSNPGQLSVGVPGTTWYTWPPILADSQWHHVVVTYTYVSDVNQTTTELWIDGISRGTRTDPGQLTPPDDWSDLLLGAEGNVYYPYNEYQGLFDEVAYYNYVLSEEQIYNHFIHGYSGDINWDGKVDFKDFAELCLHWQTIDGFDVLADVAYYWLEEY